MKVELKSLDKLLLVRAVRDVLDLSLKEAKNLIDKQGDTTREFFRATIDSEKTKEQIKAIAERCGVTCTIEERKLQEVTEDDLGVSIYSIDEMSIGWKCKALFSHKQATRILSGLRDAKFDVTETHVMYEGQKTTMLVVTKTFPTGTRKKELVEFEILIHDFMYAVCEIVDLEEGLEGEKERAIRAFDNLRDYELAYHILPESTTSQAKIEI